MKKYNNAIVSGLVIEIIAALLIFACIMTGKTIPEVLSWIMLFGICMTLFFSYLKLFKSEKTTQNHRWLFGILVVLIFLTVLLGIGANA